MSINIDEQIKLLEEQISGLKKQRDTNTKKAYLDLLEEKIRNDFSLEQLDNLFGDDPEEFIREYCNLPNFSNGWR